MCLLITDFGHDFSSSIAKKFGTVSVGFVIKKCTQSTVKTNKQEDLARVNYACFKRKCIGNSHIKQFHTAAQIYIPFIVQ